jgi:hypothetical protein
MHLDRGSEGPPGAKTQQNALGPARPWCRFAETLQTGAIVRSQRPIPGAGLQHFSRLAPKTLQTCAEKPADLRHASLQRAFPRRVSAKSPFCAFCRETWPAIWPKWPFPPPRFRKIGLLCILPRNAARILAEIAIFPAAFPQNRHSVHSGKKRGLDYGRNGHFRRRVSRKTATCAFWQETRLGGWLSRGVAAGGKRFIERKEGP